MLLSRDERSALGAAQDIAVVVDVSLNFQFPKTKLNCWRTPRANKQMDRVPSPRLLTRRLFRYAQNKRNLFLRPDQIGSSESDSHIKNQPRIFFCLLSSSWRLCVYFFLFFCSVYNPTGTFRTADKGRCVRYGTYRVIPPVYTTGITGAKHVGEFGTTSIPVPDTSVSTVRHQYRYRTLR